MQPVEEWLTLLPPVTRGYLVLAFITTVMCSLEWFSTSQMQVIGEVHLYFNFRQILQGMDFVFQMYLLVRYFRSVEEGSFRGRSGEFLWMLIVGSVLLLSVAPWVKSSATMFLGPSLTFMVVYVWARRNQFVRLSLFGLFTFTAPYLPWVLVGLDMLLGASPVKDLLGIFAGHIYYFFEDVFPRMANGYRLLGPPTLDPAPRFFRMQQGNRDGPADNAPNEHLHAD